MHDVGSKFIYVSTNSDNVICSSILSQFDSFTNAGVFDTALLSSVILLISEAIACKLWRSRYLNSLYSVNACLKLLEFMLVPWPNAGFLHRLSLTTIP